MRFDLSWLRGRPDRSFPPVDVIGADQPGVEPSFYLIDVYRTRIDPPTGMLSGVLMGKVRGGIEQGVEMNLKTAKVRVEGK